MQHRLRVPNRVRSRCPLYLLRPCAPLAQKDAASIGADILIDN